eukprot:Nitzschia sp. Nitz4//scaffold626_size2265//231//1414//NITZ4_009298-RA/size2265-processed-gene-0.8-mRNA-1//1//CDS//3329555792//8898//frame0
MATTDVSSATPWVERYRPKSLEDVSHQTEVVATLQNAVETGRLPHLLLYGPPGSGKTSVALALCRQLWHPTQWRRRVLELNASDERGISVVRDKIKHFASLSVSSETPQTHFFTKATPKEDEDTKKYPNPPFKIIILDEADTVTTDAQAALRRIICIVVPTCYGFLTCMVLFELFQEANSRITRFILICNYVTRIIEPLASRCAKFRFQALPPASMKDRLHTIAQAEHCTLTDSQLDSILNLADGDMRRAVQTLQSVHALSSGGSSSLDDAAIAELAGLPPAQVVDDLILNIKQSGGKFSNVEEAVREVCVAGYSAQILLGCMLPKLISMPDDELDELGRAKLAIRIAEAEHKMVDGADEYLQLMTVCGLAMQCFQSAANQMKMN